MQCDRCGKTFRGSGLSLTLDGKQMTLCADCYGKIKEEYDRKKNCDNCRHFKDDSCELTGSKLTSVSIGYRDYFVEAEKCSYYTEEEIESGHKAIDNLEKAGRYEEAAEECEKLGMLERAGHLREKGKKIPALSVDVSGLVRQLAGRGQTLTYHCYNCGAPLKVGAEFQKVLKICPACGNSLEAIDMTKFISQYLS